MPQFGVHDHFKDLQFDEDQIDDQKIEFNRSIFDDHLKNDNKQQEETPDG